MILSASFNHLISKHSLIQALPRFRKYPGFIKEPLAEKLQKARINYIHLKRLEISSIGMSQQISSFPPDIAKNLRRILDVNFTAIPYTFYLFLSSLSDELNFSWYSSKNDLYRMSEKYIKPYMRVLM